MAVTDVVHQRREPTPVMPRSTPAEKDSVWTVILAGGEGRRLAPLTTDPRGVRVPKQFCWIREGQSLVRTTIMRGLGLVDAERLVAAVVEEQRIWWEPELARLAPENVLVQPRNRGTGVAILHALVRILVRDPAAVIVVLPSDHDVDREEVLRHAIRGAIHAARQHAFEIVLLGTTPSAPDPKYGWIVPGARRDDDTLVVEYFVEKPGMAGYERLQRRGALCNTFILVATARALCERFRRVQPELLKEFLWRLRWSTWGKGTLERLYETAPCLDFGRDLLEPFAHSLRVFPVPPCGWADLGTPARLQAWARARRKTDSEDPPLLRVPGRGGSQQAVAIGSH